MSLPPFEDVVAEHGPTVLRICRALLGRQDADDAWSETFIAALRAYPGLDPGANVEAWLVTIAKRKVLDSYRSASRRPTPVEKVPDTAVSDPEPDAELLAAVAQLPERQREAIAYHYIGGLPYQQVAAIVGCSEAAARRAAADGVRKLRATYRGGC